MNAYQSKRHIDQVAVYLLGGIERWIEDYARSSQIPADVLTHRVAELLQLQTSGRVLGTNNHLPALQRASTGESITTSALALARGSHRRTQVRTPKPKLHWTQLPQNRKKMMSHIDAMRAAHPTMNQKPAKRFMRPYKRTAKQMAAARRNAALARKAYMKKHGKGK